MQAVQQTRDEAIASEYTTDGFSTLDSIGQKYGLTRERVRQIIAKTVSGTREELAEKRRQDAVRRHLATAENLIASDATVASIGALSEITGISIGFINDNAADFTQVTDEIARRRHQRRLDSPRPSVRKFTDEDIYSTLRRISSAHAGNPVTVTMYLEDRRADEPSLSLIQLRMGSLISACEKAGVASGAARGKRAVYGPTELINSIEKCAGELGLPSIGQLSYVQYSDWAKASRGPSASLVRLNFGSWKNAKDNALKSLV